MLNLFPFTAMRSGQRWPQWRDIQADLAAKGLASNGARLKPEGFPLTPIRTERYGVALMTCEPAQPVRRGRASPHRLKVLCTCGRQVFFGKLGQHYRGSAHR